MIDKTNTRLSYIKAREAMLKQAKLYQSKRSYIKAKQAKL